MPELTHGVRSEANLWRARIDDGIDEAERQDFEQWQSAKLEHGEAYAEARLLWDLAGRPQFQEKLESRLSPAPASEHALEDRSLEPRSHRGLVETFLSLLGPKSAAGLITAAACLALILLSGLPQQYLTDPAPQIQIFASEKGMTKAISLPDGSRITLDAGSRLALTLDEEGRRAELTQGSAFFKVARDADRSFTVTTRTAAVTVIGTEFDVQARSKTTRIAVGEGVVQVSDASIGKKAQTLRAGQMMSVNAEGQFSAVEAVYPAELGAWRSGRLVYLDTPLRDVIADLNRYSQSPISIEPDAQSLELSGTFDARDLPTLLATLEQGLPIKVAQRGGELIISRK